jgi:hypothetical protein
MMKMPQISFSHSQTLCKDLENLFHASQPFMELSFNLTLDVVYVPTIQERLLRYKI